jgi:hypothetical protein
VRQQRIRWPQVGIGHPLTRRRDLSEAFRNRAPAGLPVAVISRGQAQMFVMKIPNNLRGIAVGSSSSQLFDQYLKPQKTSGPRGLSA